jgi:hypothetical protein
LGGQIALADFCAVKQLAKPRRLKSMRNMNSPDDITKRCFDTLLAATAADNLGQFVSVGDENFTTIMRREPERLHRVSRWLTPRMQKGITPTFLGELRERGYTAYLWRLSFDDRGDDLLFRMGMRGGKVVAALVGAAFMWP